MPPHGGHGGHHGGHGGHHGGHGGHHRGGGYWGGPAWGGGYPYPASELVVVEDEDSLEKRLRELEILERIKRLQSGKPLKGVSGFDMSDPKTLLIGAAVIGAAWLLLRKKR